MARLIMYRQQHCSQDGDETIPMHTLRKALTMGYGPPKVTEKQTQDSITKVQDQKLGCSPLTKNDIARQVEATRATRVHRNNAFGPNLVAEPATKKGRFISRTDIPQALYQALLGNRRLQMETDIPGVHFILVIDPLRGHQCLLIGSQTRGHKAAKVITRLLDSGTRAEELARIDAIALGPVHDNWLKVHEAVNAADHGDSDAGVPDLQNFINLTLSDDEVY